MARAIPREQLTIFSQANRPHRNYPFAEGAAFLIDKPKGWSSFKAVSRIRKYCDLKKVGHAGTLDPMATGLLIICVGRATKTISQFQGLEKEYIGEITLGGRTASYDAETDIEERAGWQHVTEQQLRSVLESDFSGTIVQYPPVYSAIKKDGERLYKKARRGEKVDVPPRQVTIHETELLELDLPKITLRIRCSKGTYVRSIANDLGEKLNSLGYLSKLVRTAIGPYQNSNALSIPSLMEQVEEAHHG